MSIQDNYAAGKLPSCLANLGGAATHYPGGLGALERDLADLAGGSDPGAWDLLGSAAALDELGRRCRTPRQRRIYKEVRRAVQEHGSRLPRLGREPTSLEAAWVDRLRQVLADIPETLLLAEELGSLEVLCRSGVDRDLRDEAERAAVRVAGPIDVSSQLVSLSV